MTKGVPSLPSRVTSVEVDSRDPLHCAWRLEKLSHEHSRLIGRTTPETFKELLEELQEAEDSESLALVDAISDEFGDCQYGICTDGTEALETKLQEAERLLQTHIRSLGQPLWATTELDETPVVRHASLRDMLSELLGVFDGFSFEVMCDATVRIMAWGEDGSVGFTAEPLGPGAVVLSELEGIYLLTTPKMVQQCKDLGPYRTVVALSHLEDGQAWDAAFKVAKA